MACIFPIPKKSESLRFTDLNKTFKANISLDTGAGKTI